MKLKKLLPLIGLGAMTAVLLSACGGDKAKNSEKSKSEATISLMVPYIETTPPKEGNLMQQEIEKFTGKKINVTWVPNTSYADKMNITLASDDIPEVMVIQGKDAGFIKSAQNGAFWDLTDKLKDYPNLANANPDVVEASSVNGTVYGIYRGRDLVRSTAIIRKDWLENLGLEVPETVEDLYNVAKAFTEQDPDGNGQNDTFGFNMPKWPGTINTNSPYDLMACWFGAGNAWVEKDGQLVPSFQSTEYLDSMKFIKKMIDEGLVNKDYATLDAEKWNENFLNGKSGIILDTYSRAESIAKLFDQQEADSGASKIVITGNLKNSEGKTYSLPTAGYSGFLSVPKSAVKTEKELDEVLDFIDKLNSDDMQLLMNTGIEGVNYEFTDDTKQFTKVKESEQTSEITNAVHSYAQMSMGVTGYKLPKAEPTSEGNKDFIELRSTLEARDAKTAVYNPAAAYITDTYATKGAQLDQIISDGRIKYFAGQIDDKGWQDALDLWSNSGGNDIIKETNELNNKK
ncbi:extracellular solute-binding protein [Enterococcus nangangensis]|uniref:extracellular solute-binding protein n=1 Tax=Enterococcus nangangensis TaxID=2559926 RepID=UPI001FE3B8F3|nr:extracellular solute-binding protein [Enterococcus nangangensis]